MNIFIGKLAIIFIFHHFLFLYCYFYYIISFTIEFSIFTNIMLLLTLVCIPLLGIVAIAPSYRTEAHRYITNLPANVDPDTHIKLIALVISIVTFLYSLILLLLFDPTTPDYQFTFHLLNKHSHTFSSDFQMGVDGISIYFVVLTTFLFPISFLASWKISSSTTLNGNKYNVKFYLCTMLLLETLLILLFIVTDIMLFYIFFESVLIPLFLIVGIWGSSANRIRAAFLLFLFTLAGSLFMLLSILAIYYNVGSTDFQLIQQYSFDPSIQKILWAGIFISMAIKFPLWPLYSWLYRAHAEAPIAGSILLAGIVLKMATYGSLRVLLQFLPDASYYFSPLVQTMAIMSIIYASLATLRQTDFKALVATQVLDIWVLLLLDYSLILSKVLKDLSFFLLHTVLLVLHYLSLLVLFFTIDSILVLFDIIEVLLHICLSSLFYSSYSLSSMLVSHLVLTGSVNFYVLLVHIK